jgi:hypothetical protein
MFRPPSEDEADGGGPYGFAPRGVLDGLPWPYIEFIGLLRAMNEEDKNEEV